MGDSVAHVAISADGTKALAVKPVVNKVAFLKIEGQKVVYEKYDVPTGLSRVTSTSCRAARLRSSPTMGAEGMPMAMSIR